MKQSSNSRMVLSKLLGFTYRQDRKLVSLDEAIESQSDSTSIRRNYFIVTECYNSTVS